MNVGKALLKERGLVYFTHNQNRLGAISQSHDGLLFLSGPCSLYKSHQLRNSCRRLWPNARGEEATAASHANVLLGPRPAHHPMYLDKEHDKH